MIPTYLTVKQVSEWLQVKEKTLYAWAAAQRIPSIHIHGLVRFPLKELERWLISLADEQRVLPTKIKPKRSLDIQAVIAQAKRLAYTPARGNQTNSEPNGKEE